MARPLEFNRSQSVRAALFLFWRQGYLATSLTQLLEVMNIGKSSFYAAFKDKRSLFIEVLELYNRSYEDLLYSIQQSDEPADAISRYIDYSLKPAQGASVNDGCLIVNTLLELRDIDDELADLASAQLTRVEKTFSKCFERAAKAGKLYPQQNPKELAKVFMTFGQGLRVSSRKGISAKQLKAQSDLFANLICQTAKDLKPIRQIG